MGDEGLRGRVADTLAELEQEQADRQVLAGLDEARFQRLAVKDNALDRARAVPVYQAAFRAYGIDVLALSPTEAGARLRERAIRAELAAALDEWADLDVPDPQRLRLRRVAWLGDPDPWRRRLRAARGARDRAVMRELATTVGQVRPGPSGRLLLATALVSVGDAERAIEVLHEGRRRHPLHFWLNHKLADLLLTTPPTRPREAARYYTVARALRPRAAVVHFNLGSALIDSGARAEGLRAYREAIRLQPDFAWVHYNLALTLGQAGRHAEAVESFRAAIRHRPGHVEAYNNLGVALLRLQRVDEATAALKQALRLRSDNASALLTLGLAYDLSGDVVNGAATFARLAAVRPKDPFAHCYLGRMLLRQGDVDGALKALRTGHGLGAGRPDWGYPSAQWVSDAERLAGLLKRLPALLERKVEPADPAEQFGFARLCLYRGHTVRAAELFREALTARPALADDLASGYWVEAATAAAQAGCGLADAGPLALEQRTAWRRQALTWMRGLLKRWEAEAVRRTPQGRKNVPLGLRQWQCDIALACVRDPAALGRLPAEERDAWRHFWADVAELARKTGGGLPPQRQEGVRG
jgi:tetratricopeptide (TPR) repeat protein